ILLFSFFFSSRRRHTRSKRDWSSDVCSSDLSLLRLLSHHIRIHLAALIRHLCRHDKDLRVRRVFLQLPCEHFQQPVRQAAYTEEIGRASCRERVESAEGGVAVDEYGAGVGGG